MTRVSINRARLHAGKPAIRVERGKRTKHARVVAGLSFVLRSEKIRGRWFLFLYTKDPIKAL